MMMWLRKNMSMMVLVLVIRFPHLRSILMMLTERQILHTGTVTDDDDHTHVSGGTVEISLTHTHTTADDDVAKDTHEHGSNGSMPSLTSPNAHTHDC